MSQTAISQQSAAHPDDRGLDVPPLQRLGDTVAGRYRIIRVAGKGSFATVFEAQDVFTQHTLAVKVYRSLSDRSRKNAFREAAFLVEIEHPNLVRGLGVGESETGHAYVAMEWAPGDSLAKLNAEGELTVEETIVLGAVLAETLYAIHCEGVLYGDVKEANIVVPVEQGTVRVPGLKLIDFGIAKYMHHRSRTGAPQIALGRVAGTPLYMAPEQLQGRAHGIPAEVFCLGALLYGCIYRNQPLCPRKIAKWEVPYDGDRPWRIPVMRERLMQPIELPDTPSIPSRLRNTLRTALALSPEDRFQNMMEMRRALIG